MAKKKKKNAVKAVVLKPKRKNRLPIILMLLGVMLTVILSLVVSSNSQNYHSPLPVVTKPSLEVQESKPISKVEDKFKDILDEAPYGADYPVDRDYTYGKLIIFKPVITQSTLDNCKFLIFQELEAALADPNELPFVKNRIKWLLNQIKKNVVELNVDAYDSAANAFSKYEDGKFKIEFNAVLLVVYGNSLKPKAMHDFVVQAAVHESLHFRLKNMSLADRINDENKVWTIMVKNVIRPWYHRGRHPMSTSWKVAKYFGECNDNPQSPEWVNLFSQYMESESNLSS